MNNILLAILIQLPLQIFAQIITDTPLTFEFSSTTNHFTGCYTSYYNNGKIRATGNLIDGMRTGIWELHDSSGAKLTIREYIKPNCYITLYPKSDKTSKGFCTEEDFNFHERGIILNIAYHIYIPVKPNKKAFEYSTQRCIYNALMLIPGLSDNNLDFSDSLESLNCIKQKLKKSEKLTGIKMIQQYYWDRGAREGIVINRQISFIFKKNQSKYSTYTSDYKSVEPYLKQITCSGEYNHMSLHQYINSYHPKGIERLRNVKLSKTITDYMENAVVPSEYRELFFLLESEHDLWVEYQ